MPICRNYWYNQRVVGIEHAGFDATSYQWYSATEYLASAKLVAYRRKQHNIVLDHAHIVDRALSDRASSYYADANLAWVAMRPGELWIDAGTAALWVEVNFDHWEAWVPATEVVGH